MRVSRAAQRQAIAGDDGGLPLRSRRGSHQRSSNGSSGQGRDGAAAMGGGGGPPPHSGGNGGEAAAYYSHCSCRRQQWVLFDTNGLLWRSREATAAVAERSAPRPLTATRFACIGGGGEFDLLQGGAAQHGVADSSSGVGHGQYCCCHTCWFSLLLCLLASLALVATAGYIFCKAAWCIAGWLAIIVEPAMAGGVSCWLAFLANCAASKFTFESLPLYALL